MVITWYGEGCFKIQSGETVALTDPFDSRSGLTPPRLKADVILKTISPFPPAAETEENSIIGAGEYNLKGMDIWGFPVEKESTEKFLKTIYLLYLEGIKLGILGHISEIPEPAVLEHLEEIDILFVAGGGKPFLEQKAAVKLIKQLQPKIAVPAFFKIPGLKRPTADVKTLVEEFNHKKIDQQEKLSFKKKDLAEIKTTQIVILKN